MKTLSIIILLLLSLDIYSQVFHDNSIGLVYFESQTTDSVDLKIVFPMWRLEGYEVILPITEFKMTMYRYRLENKIELFNQDGFISGIYVDSVSIDFWCENDGGIQYRPTILTTINKTELKNSLKEVDDYLIMCFAIINRTDDLKNIELTNFNERIKKEGDFNKDGIPEALTWLKYDNAQNCSDGGDSIMYLNDFNKKFIMNCCGP